MAENTPIYNLKAVIKEVDLNPATLRAWERRYDLLKPRRSPGGHRLYSRRDIEMLKWLIERQKEGLTISSAVEMWKSQPDRPMESLKPVHTPVLEMSTGETILDELREQWVNACLGFNDEAANHILDQAFAVAAPEMILTEVLQKGLARIGERWYEGSASAQQEHFASAIAVRRVSALLSATARSTRPGCILAACPPGETHDFILLMISYLIKRSGWDVVYLGANVPLLDLDATIRSTSPSMIFSSAQTLKTAASLRLMSENIVQQGVPLVYGGGIFTQVPDATRYITGYYLGTDVTGVPERIEQLLTIRPEMPSALPVSIETTQALNSFTQNEASILASITARLRPEMAKLDLLDFANTHLSQFIASALTLGEINLMDHSSGWLNDSLKSHGLSVSFINHYYAVFRQVVERSLGEDGKPIQAKLSEYIVSD